MSTYTERARALRPYIVKSAASLTDADASLAPELFTRLTGSGSLVKAGTRINWGGTIKRAASDLWDTAQNTPDAAPALWEDIAYKQGFRIIPETITAGLAFSKGEKAGGRTSSTNPCSPPTSGTHPLTRTGGRRSRKKVHSHGHQNHHRHPRLCRARIVRADGGRQCRRQRDTEKRGKATTQEAHLAEIDKSSGKCRSIRTSSIWRSSG